MITAVEIVVTSVIKGFGPIVPYSHEAGLQFVVIGGVRTNRPVVYDVPIYEVKITGGSSYLALRFGLRNTGATPKTRGCDAGLSHARDCFPTWLPTYSPHSFRGGARPGAWQLLPGKGFLIHEGADRPSGQIGGSIGCVEVLDGAWNDFLAEIEKLGHGTCSQIGAAKKLRVAIQYANYPVATLR